MQCSQKKKKKIVVKIYNILYRHKCGKGSPRFNFSAEMNSPYVLFYIHSYFHLQRFSLLFMIHAEAQPIFFFSYFIPSSMDGSASLYLFLYTFFISCSRKFLVYSVLCLSSLFPSFLFASSYVHYLPLLTIISIPPSIPPLSFSPFLPPSLTFHSLSLPHSLH